MHSLTRLLVAGFVFVALPVVSARATGDKDVNVVNTPTVNARQSGPWNVNVSGTSGVVIQNGPSEPVPVTSVPTEPYSQTLNVQIAPGDVWGNTFFDVPSGKRLVVEYVSLLAYLPSGQVVHAAVGQPLGGVYHELVPTSTKWNASTDYFVVSQPIRMYVDGGPQAVAVVVQRNGTSAYAGVTAHISGYLVDKP